MPAGRAQLTTISLEPYLPRAVPARLAVVRALEAVIGLDRLRERYHGLPPARDARTFARNALDALNVSMEVRAEDLARVPRSGACIVVANHPHGGLDGLCLVSMLLSVRSDVKILANPFLMGIAELRDLFLEVDPFGGMQARTFNRQGVRAALRWLDDGGMLVMFPAGEVSSLNLASRKVVDPVWQPGAARLMRRSGAPVLPVHIGGRNSNLFQLSGLVNARLRTLLLVRELLEPRRLPIPVRIGRPVDSGQLAHADGDRGATEYLRFRTYALAERGTTAQSAIRKKSREAVSSATDPVRLAEEVDRLAGTHRLLSSGRFDVLVVRAAQAPHLMAEIGRLREISFRAAGEGTGKARDIDAFDAYYEQLFVWDRDARVVVGGYRIGHAAAILASHGVRGLYVSSLFRLSSRLRAQLAGGLELGRSFVRPEYQRGYAPLLLLWKGIAQYAIRHPEHRLLFGPVSISNDYHPVSQRILVQFLSRHYLASAQRGEAKPRQPVQHARRPEPVLAALAHPDSPLLDDLLREFEADGKGMPVLLRQYLKLGGRILGFNVDPEFSRVIDCLLLVDLDAAGEDALSRYMGRDAARAYLARENRPPQAA